MSTFFQTFRNSLLFSPVFLGLATAAFAVEASVTPAKSVDTPTNQLAQALPASDSANLLNQLNQYSNEGISSDSLEQVTSISQLRDVQPTDWAFQALQSLVERYGCIVGYPDGTYRGNRPLTRYEFAAGLNACLDRVSELISRSTENLVTREDLEALRRLQEEFAAELATLRGRVDALEARTSELEANQFSTTTKLVGEAIMTLGGAFGDEKADSNEDLDDNLTLGGRVRLALNTSFSGRDLLVTRLQAGNQNDFADATGTYQATLGYGDANNNRVTLNKLAYRFPIGDRITAYVATVAGDPDDIADPLNPLLNSNQYGALSLFAQYSPVYRMTSGGGGILDFKITPSLSLTGGYLSGTANSPFDKAGLFDGQYGAFGQLTFKPSSNFGIGFTYMHAYYPGSGDIANPGFGARGIAGFSGSDLAEAPFTDATATTANSYAGTLTWRLSSRFVISGYGGYTTTIAEDGKVAGVDQGDRASGYYWLVNFAFPDLGKPGNVLGLVFGQPPTLTSNDSNIGEDDDPTYHIEAFYSFKVTDNINVTPGAYVLINPNGDSDNDTIFVGAVRTYFAF